MRPFQNILTLLYEQKFDLRGSKLNSVLVCSVVHGRWREAKAIKASFEDELCVSLNDALVFFLLRLDESQCKSVAHEAIE